MKSSAVRRSSVLTILVLICCVANAKAGALAYQHPGTGLIFPDTVGQAKLVSVRDYEKESPGLGVGIMYRAETFKADVFLYDLDQGSVPTGAAAPLISAQFEQAVSDVYAVEKMGIYKDIVMELPKETVRVGAYSFLHSRMIFTQDSNERVSHLYLTGYKGQFVKVRITYLLSDAANGEKSLTDFLSMLAGSMKAAEQ
ncbi:MAG TPA: hypothetical protein VMT62_11685 [Syntrophorhabdaceae bacterium]|nr:hypothetical protein [Syntrophorhabdaceae bacterium]